MTCNGCGHATDWACASDQYVLAQQIEGKRSVYRVAQRIETGNNVNGNAGIGVPDVAGGNGNIFCKSSIAVHPHADCVLAQMTPARETITALAANQVTLSGDQLSNCKALHVASNRGH